MIEQFDISLKIEELVHNNNLSYMEGVLMYCDENDLEPEDLTKSLSKSIQDKLKQDFIDSGYLPKESKLEW